MLQALYDDDPFILARYRCSLHTTRRSKIARLGLSLECHQHTLHLQILLSYVLHHRVLFVQFDKDYGGRVVVEVACERLLLFTSVFSWMMRG